MDRSLRRILAATGTLLFAGALLIQAAPGSEEALPAPSAPRDARAADARSPVDEATPPETPPFTANGLRSELPLRAGVLLFATGLASLPLTLASLRWALLVPLFSRLGNEDLLEHRVRARILQLIRAEPGLGITDICQRLEIGWGTAVHHLSRLEGAALLSSADAGRRRRFFLPGTTPTVRTAMCVLTTDLNRRLLEYVRAHPGTNQTEVSRALGVSASLLHKYAKRLKAEGLLEARRQWRTVQYYAADSAASHLEEYGRLQSAPEAKGLAAPMGEA